MDKFLQYLPVILGVLVAGAAAFAPVASEWVAAHPAVSMVLAAAGTVISYFLRSPLQGK